MLTSFQFYYSIYGVIEKLPYTVAVAVKHLITPYVPFPVCLVIEGGSRNQWIAELRVVNTLFIRVKGLKYQESNDLEEVSGI